MIYDDFLMLEKRMTSTFPRKINLYTIHEQNTKHSLRNNPTDFFWQQSDSTIKHTVSSQAIITTSIFMLVLLLNNFQYNCLILIETLLQ
jgi:hypothetical protein